MRFWVYAAEITYKDGTMGEIIQEEILAEHKTQALRKAWGRAAGHLRPGIGDSIQLLSLEERKIN